MEEYGYKDITETMAWCIAMILLLLFVTAAVAVFIFCGFKTKEYEYLETEDFETEYGVIGMVKEKQKQFRDKYALYNIVGTCFCIMSAIPLFVGMAFGENVMVLSVP